jgi:hypothetical protein
VAEASELLYPIQSVGTVQDRGNCRETGVSTPAYVKIFLVVVLGPTTATARIKGVNSPYTVAYVTWPLTSQVPKLSPASSLDQRRTNNPPAAVRLPFRSPHPFRRSTPASADLTVGLD